MNTQTRNDLICFGLLIVALIIVRYVIVLGPETSMLQSQRSLFSWQAIGIIGLAGLAGVLMLNQTGLRKLWDTGVGTGRKTILPFAAGLLLGAIQSTYDFFTGAGDKIAASMGLEGMHIDFPFSIPIYTGGAIIVSTMYYLVPISLVVFLLSTKILKGKAEGTVFWTVGILIAVFEPLTNPGISVIRDVGLVALPLSLSVLVFNLAAIYSIRKFGFVAAIFLRLGHYAVWHVIYPFF
jgi:hypothetical protein